MTRTTQITKGIERAEELNNIKNKADNDLILFWHFQSIKEELKEEALINKG